MLSQTGLHEVEVELELELELDLESEVEHLQHIIMCCRSLLWDMLHGYNLKSTACVQCPCAYPMHMWDCEDRGVKIEYGKCFYRSQD